METIEWPQVLVIQQQLFKDKKKIKDFQAKEPIPKSLKFEKIEYKLCGLIEHIGEGNNALSISANIEGLDNGQYAAYVDIPSTNTTKPKMKWHRIQDTASKAVGPADVVKKTAYMLFYCKI